MSGYHRSQGAWGVLKGPGLEKCPKCGYDLRGLLEGVTCPECGTDTARHEAETPRLGAEIPLGAAPRAYLRVLRLGFVIAGAGWAVIWAQAFGWTIGSHPRSGGAMVVPGGAAVAAWGVGMWLVTRPRPIGTRVGAAWSPVREWATLRALVRLSVLAMGAAVGSIAWHISGGPLALVLVWGVCFSFATATACWYMARVVEWAPDDNLAWRIRACAWAIGAGSAITALAEGPAFGITMSVGLIFGLGFLFLGAGGVCLTIFHLQAAHMVKWAIRNMDELRARDDRMRERAEREAARAAVHRAVAPLESDAERDALLAEVERRHNEMAETGEALEPPVDAAIQGQTLSRNENAQTYGIEGETEPR